MTINYNNNNYNYGQFNKTKTGVNKIKIKTSLDPIEKPVTLPALTMDDVDDAALTIENILQDMVENCTESSNKLEIEKAAKLIVVSLMNNYVIGSNARQEYEDKIWSLQSQLSTVKTQLIEEQSNSRSPYSTRERNELHKSKVFREKEPFYANPRKEIK